VTEDLREEYVSLGEKIWHFALLRFAIAVALAVAFSNALERLEEGQFAQAATAAAVLLSGDGSDLRNIVSMDGSEIADFLAQVTDEEEREKVRGTVTTLREEYRKNFLVECDVIGLSMRFDMLFWLRWVPILLLISELYPFTLRSKKRILQAIAAASWDQAGPLDRLVFGPQPHRGSNFSSQPYKFLQQVETLFYVGCVILVLHSASQSAITLVQDVNTTLVIIAVGAWYCRAAAHGIETSLWSEVSVSPPRNDIDSQALHYVARILDRALSRVSPTFLTLGGSTLVLFSLVSGTGVEGCILDAKPVSGAQLLGGHVPRGKEWRGFFTERFARDDPASAEEGSSIRLSDADTPPLRAFARYPCSEVPPQCSLEQPPSWVDYICSPKDAIQVHGLDTPRCSTASQWTRDLYATRATPGARAQVPLATADPENERISEPSVGDINQSEEGANEMPGSRGEVRWPVEVVLDTPTTTSSTVLHYWLHALYLALIVFAVFMPAGLVVLSTPRHPSFLTWTSRVVALIALLFMFDAAIGVAAIQALPKWTVHYAEAAALILVPLSFAKAPTASAPRLDRVRFAVGAYFPVFCLAITFVVAFLYAAGLFGYMCLIVGAIGLGQVSVAGQRA
jgi:hypothetical protein